MYHSAGLDGMGSGSYIDDVVLCDADMNGGGGRINTAASTKKLRRTYLQNEGSGALKQTCPMNT